MKLSLPILLSFFAASAGAAQLTETETRWLQAGSPVLAYAKQELKLPIDIVVQPQAGPNDVPLAMGLPMAAASWCFPCAAIRRLRKCCPAYLPNSRKS